MIGTWVTEELKLAVMKGYRIVKVTTCHARLKLYAELDKLQRDVLYFDTDSIIYASNGTNDPPLGNYLGDFTDELDGNTIHQLWP